MPESSRRALPAEMTLAYELHGNCYLNITWHCTLRCDFCPKFNGTWEVQGYDLRLWQEPTLEELLAAVGDPAKYKEIVFCGLGEPTLRIDLLVELARELKARGAKRVRVNTDGLANLVHGRDVTPEMAGGEMAGVVDAVSVSLNAQDEFTYNRHCRPKQPGAFAAAQAFIAAARDAGMAVTVTAIDGLEGVDIEACRRIAEGLGVEFRRRVMNLVG